MIAPKLNKGKAMPRVWKLLIPKYILIFSLCSLCLLVLFVACKMHDMAALFSSTGQLSALWQFAGWQMLALCPFALSLSVAISSYNLFSDLRSSYELHTLRSFGISLFNLSKPLISLTLTLCLINIFIVSEISTKARSHAKQLAYEFALKTPLISTYHQLENTPESKAIATLESETPLSQEKLSNFWLFTSPAKGKPLQLVRAGQLRLSGKGVIGKNIDVLSYVPAKEAGNFDTIMLEKSRTAIANISPIKELLFPQKETASLSGLRFKELLASLDKPKDKAYELLRRICFGFAPITLFFLAMAASLGGVRTGPSGMQKGLFSLSFILFFIGLILSKSHGFALMAPAVHLQALILSFVCLRRYERGLL